MNNSLFPSLMIIFSFVFHLGAVIVQVLNMQCISTTVDLITDNTCHDTFHKLDNFLIHMKKQTHKNNETMVNKGNNKITELRTILQRESQNS